MFSANIIDKIYINNYNYNFYLLHCFFISLCMIQDERYSPYAQLGFLLYLFVDVVFRHHIGEVA